MYVDLHWIPHSMVLISQTVPSTQRVKIPNTFMSTGCNLPTLQPTVEKSLNYVRNQHYATMKQLSNFKLTLNDSNLKMTSSLPVRCQLSLPSQHWKPVLTFCLLSPFGCNSSKGLLCSASGYGKPSKVTSSGRVCVTDATGSTLCPTLTPLIKRVCPCWKTIWCVYPCSCVELRLNAKYKKKPAAG